MHLRGITLLTSWVDTYHITLLTYHIALLTVSLSFPSQSSQWSSVSPDHSCWQCVHARVSCHSSLLLPLSKRLEQTTYCRIGNRELYLPNRELYFVKCFAISNLKPPFSTMCVWILSQAPTAQTGCNTDFIHLWLGNNYNLIIRLKQSTICLHRT